MITSMSNKFSVKDSEKLPRGSYFYIQVGHRFFASFQDLSEEKEIEDNFPPISFFTKDGKRSPALETYQRKKYGYYTQKLGPRGRRATRDLRKKTLPSYAKTAPIVISKVKFKKSVGKLSPRLVDSVDQAKKYRRLSQAKNACEKLKRTYGSLVTNIQVRFYQGDTQ